MRRLDCTGQRGGALFASFVLLWLASNATPAWCRALVPPPPPPTRPPPGSGGGGGGAMDPLLPG